jgi:hypothetical protein
MEISKILGLSGKAEGIDGSRVEEMVLSGKSKKWRVIVNASGVDVSKLFHIGVEHSVAVFEIEA